MVVIDGSAPAAGCDETVLLPPTRKSLRQRPGELLIKPSLALG
jgi:hypothetical protein